MDGAILGASFGLPALDDDSLERERVALVFSLARDP